MKQEVPVVTTFCLESLPTRGRGLKLPTLKAEHRETKVAPYAGAWIETERDAVMSERDASRSLRGGVD